MEAYLKHEPTGVVDEFLADAIPRSEATRGSKPGTKPGNEETLEKDL